MRNSEPGDKQQVLFVTPKQGDLGPLVELGHFNEEATAFEPEKELLTHKPAFVINEVEQDITYYLDDHEVEYWMPAPELPEEINGRSE